MSASWHAQERDIIAYALYRPWLEGQCTPERVRVEGPYVERARVGGVRVGDKLPQVRVLLDEITPCKRFCELLLCRITEGCIRTCDILDELAKVALKLARLLLLSPIRLRLLQLLSVCSSLLPVLCNSGSARAHRLLPFAV